MLVMIWIQGCWQRKKYTKHFFSRTKKTNGPEFECSGSSRKVLKPPADLPVNDLHGFSVEHHHRLTHLNTWSQSEAQVWDVVELLSQEIWPSQLGNCKWELVDYILIASGTETWSWVLHYETVFKTLQINKIRTHKDSPDPESI